jgi:hypothetical protein
LRAPRTAPARSRPSARLALVAALACLASAPGTVGCGGSKPAPQSADRALVTRSTGSGRPPLSVVVREGDARGALAVAVTTAGIAQERGAIAGVALAALVEARLAGRGVEVTAVGGWDGWRLRALVASPAEAARVVEAVRGALLTPVDPREPALANVTRKAGALARRPLPDPALVDVARCTGEAYAAGDPASAGDVSAADLEAWRAAAHGLGRVAIATAGDAALADATAVTLERAPSWPGAAPVPSSTWPSPQAPPQVYAAGGEVPPGAARIVVTARTAGPERAVASAAALGDPAGPLASRLAALDAPARVRSVTAAAHVDGGCVAATIDLASRDLKTDAAARIATAAVLARQEVGVEIADGAAPSDLGDAITRRAADPRDAAERAAWWSLAGRRADATDDDPVMAIAVGVAAKRDAPADASAPAGGADAIRAAIERAAAAWRAPVIETRTRVERGQGEAWVLLASPCGTASESTGNAGIGAAVALAAAAQASEIADDARVEPFVDPSGIGLLVHGPARPGESPQAHARRLADIAARAFAADEIAPVHATAARTTLIAGATESGARALGGLAAAVAPGHPSWVAPEGTLFGLSSLSDDAIAARAASLRGGPLRLAVMANVDAAQADAAARAVDRWIARRPGEARSCPAAGAPMAPREGTYAVDVAPGAPSEVLLGAPLPADGSARAPAAWIAAALDGSDGLLARALGGSPSAPPLARAWDASVLGAPHASALVVRIAGADPSVDAAVAQVRALLDRLRQGALREEDRAHAAAALGKDRLAASLDPRARVIDLWRGEGSAAAAPSLDDLKAFAAAALRDEHLVIVAARPPRPAPDPPRSRSETRSR